MTFVVHTVDGVVTGVTKECDFTVDAQTTLAAEVSTEPVVETPVEATPEVPESDTPF